MSERTDQNPYTFVFDGYELGPGRELHFRYHYESTSEISGGATGNAVIGSFDEYYVLPADIDVSDPTIAYILMHLHIIVGISYYKSLLGEVRLPYALTADEAEYFNTVYHEGLGEFTYINRLVEPIRPFHASERALAHEPVTMELEGGLLGIGGGKDSIVAAEVLKAVGMQTTVLDIATRDNHGQAGAVMDISGLPQLRISRYLDTGISAFAGTHGGMRGHIPLSVLLAWLGILVAVSTGKQYVMMANEGATSSGNVSWNGREINHQWAKSFFAEQLTQRYVHKHISPDLWYFSPIRQYGSLAVMELFARLGQQYYDDFTSCNLVLRINPATRPNGRWCTQCAKCLSTWLLLSPWLDTERLTKMFGHDLSRDLNLRPVLEALLGLSGHKPLDCVGTIEELRVATKLVLHRGDDWPLLADITADMLPSPSLTELVSARGDANIPPRLQADIEAYVAGLHII